MGSLSKIAKMSSAVNNIDNLVVDLKMSITDKMPLGNIIDVFEQMCQFPIKNVMILFETGTYSFTGKPWFYFSLVRQFPNEEEEYYQIHVNVLYKPTCENQAFHKAIWDEDLNENIFDYVRESQAFAYAQREEYVRIEIFMDET